MGKVKVKECQPVNIVAKPDKDHSSQPDVFNIATPAHREICQGEVLCMGKGFVTAHCAVEFCKCPSVELHNCTTARKVPNPLYDENAADPTAVVIDASMGMCPVYLDLADPAAAHTDMPANYDEYGDYIGEMPQNGYTVVQLDGDVTETSKKLGLLSPGKQYLACDEYISVLLDK